MVLQTDLEEDIHVCYGGFPSVLRATPTTPIHAHRCHETTHTGDGQGGVLKYVKYSKSRHRSKIRMRYYRGSLRMSASLAQRGLGRFGHGG